MSKPGSFLGDMAVLKTPNQLAMLHWGGAYVASETGATLGVLPLHALQVVARCASPSNSEHSKSLLDTVPMPYPLLDVSYLFISSF